LAINLLSEFDNEDLRGGKGLVANGSSTVITMQQ